MQIKPGSDKIYKTIFLRVRLKKVYCSFYLLLAFRLLGYHTPLISQNLPIDTLYIKQLIDSAFFYSNINQQKANTYIEQVRWLSMELKYPKGMAYYYRVKGLINYFQVNYISALDNSLTALKCFQYIGDKKGEAIACNFIGLIYSDQKYFSRAMEYYRKGLEIRKAINDTNGIAASYNNIGVYFKEINILDSALFFYRKAKSIIENTNDNESLSLYLENIGRVFIEKNLPDSAIGYFNQSLQLRLKANDLHGLANIYTSIGNYHLAKNNCFTAIDFYKQGMKYSKIINILYEIESAAAGLYRAYARCGNYQEAFRYHVLYKNIYDSARLDQISKRISQIEMESAFDKERELEKIKEINKEIKHNILIRRQEIVRNYILIALFVVILFTALIWKSYKRKRNDNIILQQQKNEITAYLKEIEQQNEEITSQRDEIESKNKNLTEAYMLIEKKNKNITDSIKYAQKLQYAILPPAELINRLIPDSFIIYMPKSIVSGDFYWLDYKNGFTYIAAVDCTGHGVPGALMSMIGYNLLNQALNELNLFNTHEIVNKLNVQVQRTLRQSDNDGSMNDGMDMVLCRIDMNNMIMQYTAVLNSFFLIRNSELLEMKGEKWPIGKAFNTKFETYTSHELSLEKGDIIYLFSDGYQDQYNHKSDKKFMITRFKSMLLEISSKPLPEQKEHIQQTFTNWKGKSDQIDDVLVMGIKI